MPDSKSGVITTRLWDQKTTLKGLNVAVTAGSQDQINSLVAVLLLYGETVWCHLMSDPTTMSPAGFEPALPKETDLKSVALDHSAKGTLNCCIVGGVTVL